MKLVLKLLREKNFTLLREQFFNPPEFFSKLKDKPMSKWILKKPNGEEQWDCWSDPRDFLPLLSIFKCSGPARLKWSECSKLGAKCTSKIPRMKRALKTGVFAMLKDDESPQKIFDRHFPSGNHSCPQCPAGGSRNVSMKTSWNHLPWLLALCKKSISRFQPTKISEVDPLVYVGGVQYKLTSIILFGGNHFVGISVDLSGGGNNIFYDGIPSIRCKLVGYDVPFCEYCDSLFLPIQFWYAKVDPVNDTDYQSRKDIIFEPQYHSELESKEVVIPPSPSPNTEEGPTGSKDQSVIPPSPSPKMPSTSQISVGLKNHGTTCWINTAIQGIFSLPFIASAIIDLPLDSFEDSVWKRGHVEKKPKWRGALQSLQTLLKDMRESRGERLITLQPKLFITRLALDLGKSDCPFDFWNEFLAKYLEKADISSTYTFQYFDVTREVQPPNSDLVPYEKSNGPYPDELLKIGTEPSGILR
jgi:hypothetical protein